MKVILSVLVTALVVGLGTYYFVNSKAETDKAVLQGSIDSLNSKVAALEKPKASTQSASDTTPSTSSSKTYADSTYGYSFNYDSEYTTSTNKSMEDAFWSNGAAFSDSLGKPVSRLASTVLSNSDNKKQIQIAVFNVAIKDGDYIYEGSDQSVATKKTASNITTGYFLAGVPDMGAQSTCGGRSLFIPKGSNTIMITVIGCDVSSSVLEQTRTSILGSFKFTD